MKQWPVAFAVEGHHGGMVDRSGLKEAIQGPAGNQVVQEIWKFAGQVRTRLGQLLELTESTAIVTYDVVLQVPPEEAQGPPPRYQHWSSVWTKQGDQWKLKFQQATPTHWGDW